MNADALRAVATDQAEQMLGSELTHPFGFEIDVYKVRDKMFMFIAMVAGKLLVTVKADPRDAEVLRESFADITPGYHMNKRHWITLTPGDSLSDGLVRDIVEESYLRVVETLPRAIRPVEPEAFGERSAR